ncbi:MAG: hypothetical protein LPK00_05590 [Bacillaceae bacterium]|nr:hypothetical protein [Bacillaceae bacterium]
MIEKRLDKMEDMLSQLIQMVGSMKVDQEEMKKEQLEMKIEQKEMKQTQKSFEQLLHELKYTQEKMVADNERDHHEILKRLKGLERDQDFIWEKSVRNERDIIRLMNKDN